MWKNELKTFILFIFLASFFLGSCSNGDGSGTQGTGVYGINTNGAEDTPFISSDGTHLYFNYSPIDFYAWQQESNANKVNRQYVLDNLIVGPWRPGFSVNEFMNDVGYGLPLFRTYVSTKMGATQWSEPVIVSFVNPERTRAIMSVSNDELTAYMLCNMNLCTSTRASINDPFSDPQLVASVQSAFDDDDFRISSDGLLLFFDSSRAFPSSSLSGPHLWISQVTGGAYSAPAAITTINTVDQEFEKFPFYHVATSTLYFIQIQISDGSKILMQSIRSGSTWGTPTEVIIPGINLDYLHPPVAASLPNSGDRIYFEYGVETIFNGSSSENYDIYYSPYAAGNFGNGQPVD